MEVLRIIKTLELLEYEIYYESLYWYSKIRTTVDLDLKLFFKFYLM